MHRSYGLQHLRHKRPTFAFTGESGYTLGSAQRIAHSDSHGETRAFPPSATAQSCATSEITLYAVFVTPDSATLLYTYISRFSVTPHYQQQLYLRPSFIAFFNFLHKWPTFAFTSESVYTLAFRRKIAHKGTHGETEAVSDGAAITTLDTSRTFTNIPGPGIRTANFAAFGSWPGVRQKDAESLRDSDALMRVAVPRRRGPAGLRDLFSFLLKLRLVRPVPDTSFGSPDAPACAVPVQALSRLALFQLGVVQGFSLFPFCLTLFDLLFESGDKKRPSTFRTLRPVNGQFFGIQFFKLAGGKRFVKTVCGRQVHRG